MMNTSAATTFAPPPRAAYLPQMDRLGLLHRGIGLVFLMLLTVYLSVFVFEIDPKISLLTCTVCAFLGGKRLMAPAVWPLIAIIFYTAFLSVVCPGAKPEIGEIMSRPLFLLNCVLLAALVLGGQSVGRQYTLLMGMLVISLIGAVGDYTGHDMTALLPFKLPDDELVNVLVLQQGDLLRIRGFFSEAGVLGAASIGAATTIVLGTAVLLRNRAATASTRLWLLAAVVIGLAIFGITVTKSGFVMILAGAIGFAAVLLVSRNARCRLLAMSLFFALIIGGGVFFTFGPPTLTNYLKSELAADIDPLGLTPSEMGEHSGVISRYKCWVLAFTSLEQRPLGVGPYGLGAVLQNTGNVGLTREMRFYFNRDTFGLKNALANLISQTGVVGIGLLLYWLWAALVRPARHYLADGSYEGTLIAGLYGSALLSALIFLFACETYPSLAFLLVLKFHADAVAQACANNTSKNTESLELIG